MNLRINAQTNRLIAEDFDTDRVGNQKEGIAIVKGAMAKVQLKLGLAEMVTINGQEVVINKHSRNKFLARTTKDSGVNTIGRFGKAHRIIDAAIRSSGLTTLTTLSNHVQAQTIGGVEKTHFTTEQGTKDLFDREVKVIEAKAAEDEATAHIVARPVDTKARDAARLARADKVKAKKAEMTKAATTIQTAFRGLLAKKAVSRLKSEAATKRTKVDFQARKASVWATSMADVVSGKAKTPATLLKEKREAAAKTIQAAFKSLKAMNAAKQVLADLKAEKSSSGF